MNPPTATGTCCTSFWKQNTEIQECIPEGCVPSAAVAVSGGGVCLGVCLPRGVSAQGACTPPPVCTEFLTYTCENITFLQLCLQAIKIKHRKGQPSADSRCHSFSMPISKHPSLCHTIKTNVRVVKVMCEFIPRDTSDTYRPVVCSRLTGALWLTCHYITGI